MLQYLLFIYLLCCNVFNTVTLMQFVKHSTEDSYLGSFQYLLLQIQTYPQVFSWSCNVFPVRGHSFLDLRCFSDHNQFVHSGLYSICFVSYLIPLFVVCYHFSRYSIRRSPWEVLRFLRSYTFCLSFLPRCDYGALTYL